MSEAIDVVVNNNNNNHHSFDDEIELTLDEILAQKLIMSTPIDSAESFQQHMKTSAIAIHSETPSIINSNNNHEVEFTNSTSPLLNDNSSSNNNNNSSLVTRINNFSFKTNKSLSFLHAVFDNIVGPKCLHFWSTHTNEFNNCLLKYIAVHTLNGELYNQDKLFNSFKYRFYSIKEVNYAMMSIFFDANTIYTQNHHHMLSMSINTNNRKDSSIYSSSSSLNQMNHMQLTVLNCLSIIVPLELQQYLLDKSDFILSAFENCILEFRVLAEVLDKVEFLVYYTCQLI